jgi:nitrite reductase/ring-hydroxylating ferredoxin subunit
MSSFRDDRAVAARILAHIEAGTTDASDGVWREPVANYRSPDRLRAELEVLRRHPRPLCPAVAVPEAGRFLTVRADGRSIVVVRGSDGVVRGFLNACRHRGNEIAEGSGAAKAFVCRYHGWTYDLEGALRHVPHQDGFPGLDPGCHGLVAVVIEERHGIVFLAGAGAPGGVPQSSSFSRSALSRQDSRQSDLPSVWRGCSVDPRARKREGMFGLNRTNVLHRLTVG